MTDVERWAATWQRASRALADLEARADPIDTQQSVRQLMPAFRLAREAEPHTVTSGLVTMRRLLDRNHG